MNLDTQDNSLSSGAGRKELLERVNREVTEFQDATNAVDQAVADHLGINRTDLACLVILMTQGPRTAGAIAQASALTSGSVTAVLDRMERAGYLRRVSDPGDRRRVLAELTPLARERVALLYGPIDEASRQRMGHYSTGQLETISDFLRLGTHLQAEQAVRIREDLVKAQTGAPLSALLGAVRSGRLLFAAGASKVTLAVDSAMPDLFRVRFEGSPPRVEAQGGVVTIRYRRHSLLDLGKHQSAEVILNGTIPWSVEVRGGFSRMGGDLTGLSLASFDVQGGASKLAVTLPSTTDVVPVRLSGGASQLNFLRPAGVGARLTVKGGVDKLVVDGERVGSVAGSAKFDYPAGAGQGSYDIEIRGGASQVRIDTLPAEQTEGERLTPE